MKTVFVQKIEPQLKRVVFLDNFKFKLNTLRNMSMTLDIDIKIKMNFTSYSNLQLFFK